ncbi:MAG: tyrosine-type recombinase/integrase [Planctomycetales bacterium]|nr:tyrosine-type recombinase/integrase [Planctomycetales bacterium]
MEKQKTSFSGQKQALEPVTSRCKVVRTPKLRHHKPTGQAYVVLSGKYIFFGPYGSPGVEEQYHRTIAEWHANDRQPGKEPEEITITELLARFWVHAESYYRDAAGNPTTEIGNLRVSLRPMCEIYGNTKAIEFGPRALKTVRKRMIDRGLCRNHINKCICRIKMLFKWATAEEILPGSVYHALLTVPGLKKGRDGACESEPVKPVPQEYVEAIQPHVSRQVWAVIQLQLLTAARPGEILKLRPCDIDCSGKIWFYCPAEHKTAHHGHERKIYMGPRAQAVLRPFLLRPADAYCFSPAEAEAERRVEMHRNRKTPQSCGNLPGTNCKENPRRTKGDVYAVTAYRRAIERAIEAAFPPPELLAQQPGESKTKWQKRLTPKQKAELKAWFKQYYWHPHQLRHNAATFLRKEFGLETARIILGHRSAVITEVYAELDQQKALEAIVKVG